MADPRMMLNVKRRLSHIEEARRLQRHDADGGDSRGRSGLEPMTKRMRKVCRESGCETYRRGLAARAESLGKPRPLGVNWREYNGWQRTYYGNDNEYHTFTWWQCENCPYLLDHLMATQKVH